MGLVGAAIAATGEQDAAMARVEESEYKELDGAPGLLYKVIQEGSGEKVQKGEQVQVIFDEYLWGFPGQTIGKKQPFKISTSQSTNDFQYGQELVVTQPAQWPAGAAAVDGQRWGNYRWELTKGWDFMVLDMKEGERRQIIIPPELAYGGGRNPIKAIKNPDKAKVYMDIQVIDKGMPAPKTGEMYTGERETRAYTKAMSQRIAVENDAETRARNEPAFGR